MKTLRQITKIVMTPDALKAVCVNTKGVSIAVGIDLISNPEMKKLVDEFSVKLLDILEKEIS
jgi:hypothetical protein